MLFIVPTSAQLNDLHDLVARGLDDMSEQAKSGNLLADGYTQEEIVAFESRSNDQQGVMGMLGEKASADKALARLSDQPVQSSALIGENVMRAHYALTQGQAMDDKDFEMQEEVLVDLLADLKCYARQQGIDFDAIADLASRHLQNEQSA